MLSPREEKSSSILGPPWFSLFRQSPNDKWNFRFNARKKCIFNETTKKFLFFLRHSLICISQHNSRAFFRKRRKLAKMCLLIQLVFAIFYRVLCRGRSWCFRNPPSYERNGVSQSIYHGENWRRRQSNAKSSASMRSHSLTQQPLLITDASVQQTAIFGIYDRRLFNFLFMTLLISSHLDPRSFLTAQAVNRLSI